ncbi:protease inhibitor I42 family protein [Butyrivibrio sp. MC2013]|uniref:protease inhibitor I42 family protein n=1 Tax=Butyrivibrio sp. MC2013 TaxID=1280686 RepID=UPI00040BFE05|nr:protease inhibitor I42 family protein [Butyrivibrio sp. MC2013]
MRNIVRRLSGLLVLLALLITACASSKPQTMTLSLESNQTTGYSWTLAQEPELFDVQDEYIEKDHSEDMVGVGGQHIFTLTPKMAGKTELTFTYARPWEDPETDTTVIEYTVIVSDKMNITVESSRFAGGNDINDVPVIPDPVIK